jgi:hypothetical protein
MSTPQNAFSSIPEEELSSVAGGLATASTLSDPKLRPLFHLTREISQLGQQQQQSQSQATQTMLMAAVMSRAMR